MAGLLILRAALSRQVKLADFGVATKLEAAGLDTQANSVVGTPYWMAPEIIQMSGFTTASDIWSVGCTAVESSPAHRLSPPMNERSFLTDRSSSSSRARRPTSRWRRCPLSSASSTTRTRPSPTTSPASSTTFCSSASKRTPPSGPTRCGSRRTRGSRSLTTPPPTRLPTRWPPRRRCRWRGGTRRRCLAPTATRRTLFRSTSRTSSTRRRRPSERWKRSSPTTCPCSAPTRRRAATGEATRPATPAPPTRRRAARRRGPAPSPPSPRRPPGRGATREAPEARRRREATGACTRRAPPPPPPPSASPPAPAQAPPSTPTTPRAA